jgi:hypothetical protein
MVKFHRPTHLLAYFGYPQAHEHDAERAVRAGLNLVEPVPKLSTAAGSLSLLKNLSSRRVHAMVRDRDSAMLKNLSVLGDRSP